VLKKPRIIIAILDFLSTPKWKKIGAFVSLFFENGITSKDCFLNGSVALIG